MEWSLTRTSSFGCRGLNALVDEVHWAFMISWTFIYISLPLNIRRGVALFNILFPLWRANNQTFKSMCTYGFYLWYDLSSTCNGRSKMILVNCWLGLGCMCFLSFFVKILLHFPFLFSMFLNDINIFKTYSLVSLSLPIVCNIWFGWNLILRLWYFPITVDY